MHNRYLAFMTCGLYLHDAGGEVKQVKLLKALALELLDLLLQGTHIHLRGRLAPDGAQHVQGQVEHHDVSVWSVAANLRAGSLYLNWALMSTVPSPVLKTASHLPPSAVQGLTVASDTAHS